MYDRPLARKTEVISLRLPSDKADVIRNLAVNRRISLNVLLNHILDDYLDFNVSAKSIGYMTLPRKTVISLLELVDEEEVTKIGIPTQSVLIELVYLMKGKFTLQSFLNTLFAWLRDSRFAYSDNFDNETRTISVNHNMGRKWSLLLKEVISMVMNELQVPIKFKVLPNILVLNVKEREEESDT